MINKCGQQNLMSVQDSSSEKNRESMDRICADVFLVRISMLCVWPD